MPRLLSGSLGPGELKRLLFLGEVAELGDLAFAEREDICEAALAPFLFGFQPHSHFNDGDDLVAGGDEPLRLATAFGPGGARFVKCSFTAASP